MNSAEQWVGAMRNGDFERAWRLSDQDLRERPASSKHSGPRHLQRIWHGEPLADARVLVRCYHGLGDTIQFIRFVAPLRRLARQVIVWCQPELLELVSRIPDVDCALPLHDGAPRVEFRVDVEVMELPHALRTTPHGLAVPYLFSPAARDLLRAPGLNVGIAWQSGGWDLRRSIPIAALAQLAHVNGVQLHALQSGDGPGSMRMIDSSSPSLDTLAGRMSALDLVISVDSMPAHLAGALGRPVWTLLHADSDWRWGSGSSCVWYPTMRLFRQQRMGDWQEPIQCVAAALRQLADGAPANTGTRLRS